MNTLPTRQAAFPKGEHTTSGGGGALGGPIQAAPAHPLPVGSVGFGPNWSPELADEVMTQMADSIVELTGKLQEAEAAVALLNQGMRMLAKERDEAHQKTDALITANAELAELAWEWRKCAVRLAESIRLAPVVPTNSMKSALAEFMRLKEASK